MAAWLIKEFKWMASLSSRLWPLVGSGGPLSVVRLHAIAIGVYRGREPGFTVNVWMDD